MRCAVVLHERWFGSGVASVTDILRTADQLRGEVDAAIPPFEVVFAGARKHTESGSGLRATVDVGFDELDGVDVLVVPGMGTSTIEQVRAALATRTGRLTRDGLERVGGSVRLAAACTGVFPVAEAGLADGHTVTTTWFLGAAFRRRYPAVDLDLDAMVVADRSLLTAGAAFAHVDLALTLVREVSPQLADRVARVLVLDQRPSQSAYLAYGSLAHGNELVRSFERHVRAHLAEPFDVASVAAAIGTSRRTLERQTRDAVGLTPLGIVQRLRVERAQHLRRSTGMSIERIASEVGYRNASTLRTLLRRAG